MLCDHWCDSVLFCEKMGSFSTVLFYIFDTFPGIFSFFWSSFTHLNVWDVFFCTTFSLFMFIFLLIALVAESIDTSPYCLYTSITQTFTWWVLVWDKDRVCCYVCDKLVWFIKSLAFQSSKPTHTKSWMAFWGKTM